MKRNNKLISYLSCVALTSLQPIIMLTACGNKQKIDHTYDSLAEELKDSTINEFKAFDGTFNGQPISRASHHLTAAYNYLMDKLNTLKDQGKISGLNSDKYGVDMGFVTAENKFGNIWFDVPATPGYENKQTVILQAHYDMVWACADDQHSDPTTTKIELVDEIENGKRVIHSKDYKTSIGADNGIGLSMILSIIQNNNAKHGPLRVVFTADEETACMGSGYIYKKDSDKPNKANRVINSDYLINIDAETYNELFASCAGVLQSNFTTEEVENNIITPSDKQKSFHKYTLTVQGLNGGHSGLDIGKGGANAIKIANTVLTNIVEDFGTQDLDENSGSFHILSYSTPNMSEDAFNAIPTSCVVEFAMSPTRDIFEKEREIDYPKIVNEVIAPQLKSQWSKDTEMKIELKDEGKISDLYSDSFKMFNHKTSIYTLRLIDGLPYGVELWKDGIVGSQPIVSSNLAPINMNSGFDSTSARQLLVKTYSRANNELSLNEYYINLKELSKQTIYQLDTSKEETDFFNLVSDMPPYILSEEKKVFPDQIIDYFKSFGVDTTIVETHGGLETSWFGLDNPNIYMAALGVTIHDCHTINEKCEVDTIPIITKVILKTLENMPNI